MPEVVDVLMVRTVPGDRLSTMAACRVVSASSSFSKRSFSNLPIVNGRGASVKYGHCEERSWPGRCWDCCSAADCGCARDYILRMVVQVFLESHESEGTGRVHGGAHFLSGIV